MTWDEPIEGTRFSYRIERDVTNGFTTALVIAEAFSAADLRIVDSDGIAPASTYHYRIRAESSRGMSDWVTITASTGGLATVTPQAPSNLTAVELDGIAVKLTWGGTYNRIYTTFRIERATNSPFTQNHVTLTTTRTQTDFIDHNITTGIRYYYRVRATRRGVSGSWSATSIVIGEEIVTEDPIPELEEVSVAPTIPRNFELVPRADEIIVLWHVPARGDPLITYFLDRATDENFTQNVVELSRTLVKPSIQPFPFADRDLDSGTRYYYRIRAINTTGISPWTYADTTTLQATQAVPSSPGNLAISVSDGTSLIFRHRCFNLGHAYNPGRNSYVQGGTRGKLFIHATQADCW